MDCPQCGTENKGDSKFCCSCGTSLSNPSEKININIVSPEDTKTTKANSTKDKQELAGFVLAIIGISLFVVPIPLLSWFSFPCSLVGLSMILIVAQRTKRSRIPYTTKTIVGFVFSLYVVAYNLLSCMASTGDGSLEEALGSTLMGIIGSAI